MTPWPDVRRHSDGSIDFDFYRRQATVRRRLARQRVFQRCLALICQAPKAILVALERAVRGVSKVFFARPTGRACRNVRVRCCSRPGWWGGFSS